MDPITEKTGRQAALRMQLNLWAEQAEDTKENRQEAVVRSMAAYENQTTYLDLSGLELTSLPASLKQLTSLQQLNLCGNQLRSFPKNKQLSRRLNSGFYRRIKLATAKRPWEELHGQQRQKEENLGIKGLKNLPNLQKLDLSRNPRLIKLPSSLGRCRQLKSLDISYTKVHKIPHTIGQLNRLEEFVIDSTPVQFLPRFSSFSRLERFSCANSHLRKLPTIPRYGNKLARLKRLNCSATPLKQLPRGFGRLSQLEQVNFNDSSLKKLPADFKKLTALSSCNLRNIRLKKWDINLRSLPNLRTLDLQQNQLSKRPNRLQNLGDQVQLKLEGNLFKLSPKNRRAPTIPEPYNANALANQLAAIETSQGVSQPTAPPPSYSESNPFLPLTGRRVDFP